MPFHFNIILTDKALFIRRCKIHFCWFFCKLNKCSIWLSNEMNSKNDYTVKKIESSIPTKVTINYEETPYRYISEMWAQGNKTVTEIYCEKKMLHAQNEIVLLEIVDLFFVCCFSFKWSLFWFVTKLNACHQSMLRATVHIPLSLWHFVHDSLLSICWTSALCI